MARYIDAEVLKALMIKWGFHAPDMTITEFVEDEIPTIEAKPRWLSCSERLPRYNEDVLVYRPKMAMKIIVDRYSGYYGEDINNLDEWFEGWTYSDNCVVLAWMPLPEPYKMDEEEE